MFPWFSFFHEKLGFSFLKGQNLSKNWSLQKFKKIILAGSIFQADSESIIIIASWSSFGDEKLILQVEFHGFDA